MPSITIREVPQEVRDALAARAARAGRSLQEHLLRELIALAEMPTVEEVLDRAAERARAFDTRLTAAAILAHRDADRK